MKAPREGGIVDSIRERILLSGRWCKKIHGNLYQSGLPDIIVHLRRPRGRALWLEVKRPGEEPTKLQLAVMAEIRASGAAAHVVRSADEALAAIAEEERAWTP